MQSFVHAKGQLVYYLLSDFWRKHLSISAIEYFFLSALLHVKNPSVRGRGQWQWRLILTLKSHVSCFK
jgi:hypothetical protein